MQQDNDGSIVRTTFGVSDVENACIDLLDVAE
jgi:hypothetical protein